jgi:hypothetical protein
MSYIEQVSESADNHMASCYEFAKQFVLKAKASKGVPFTSEDIIDLYNTTDNPKPREPRVWGAVLLRLKNQGHIIPMGYVPYRKKCGHGKPSRVWVAKF